MSERIHESFSIDLTGIEHKFFATRHRVCADCDRDFDFELNGSKRASASEDGDVDIPLLMWRDNGRLMLTLCWPCARKRFVPNDPVKK